MKRFLVLGDMNIPEKAFTFPGIFERIMKGKHNYVISLCDGVEPADVSFYRDVMDTGRESRDGTLQIDTLFTGNFTQHPVYEEIESLGTGKMVAVTGGFDDEKLLNVLPPYYVFKEGPFDILLIHGHQITDIPVAWEELASKYGANVVIHGGTGPQYNLFSEGTRCRVSPGSFTGTLVGSQQKSFVMLTTAENRAVFEFYETVSESEIRLVRQEILELRANRTD